MQDNFDLEYLTSQLENKLFAQKMKDKLFEFYAVLQSDKIDLQKLMFLCSTGIPEDLKGLRSLCWKLLIGYLPPDKSQWKSTIAKQQQIYHQFCAQFFNKKQIFLAKYIFFHRRPENTDQQYSSNVLQQQQPTQIKTVVKDHPLSRNKTSSWATFFEDQALWDEIERDSIRTRSELSFFSSQTALECKFPIPFRTAVQKAKTGEVQTNFDVLTRILYIYAKLNPGIRYVVAIYLCDEMQARQSTEFDAFFSFTIFMSEAKDNFLRSLDNSQDGIKAKVLLFSQYLKASDDEISEHFEKLGINHQFYSLRWIMLFFTQEFELFDVLRLWDSLLSHSDKSKFVIYLCLAIIDTSRAKLLIEDFTSIMQHLQNLQGEDILLIINRATEISKNWE